MLRRIKDKLRFNKRRKPAPTPPVGGSHGIPIPSGKTDPKCGNEAEFSFAPAPENPPVEKSPAPVQSESSTRDLWQEALQKLPADAQQKLKSMGLDELKSASIRSEIDDLVNFAKEKQEECEKRFWRLHVGDNQIVLRDYAIRIVGWLQQTGDIAIQFAPPQASLPWTVIKSVMQIPVIEDEQMCALLASIEKIIRIINRGQVYELVYTPNTTPDDALKNFHTALKALYGTALNLLADSGTLFSAGTAKRTVNAILNPGKVPGILSDLSDQEDDLAREVQACESRRSALANDRLMDTLQALDAPLVRVDENVRGLLQHVNEKDRIELLEWISRIPYGKHHNNIRDKRTPDTGEWLLRHQKFRTWEDASSSLTFWLQGSPGTGKTVLTSGVIDHVQGVLETAPNDEGFGFFYCDRNEKVRSQPLSILQSYVRQLSTPVSNPESMQTKLWETCKKAREDASDLNFGTCKEQLLESLNLYPKTTLVLDALDECEPDSRVDIIDTLNSLLSKSQRPLKVFISSRPDPDIEVLLTGSIQVSIQANDNKGDVRRFLDKEIEKLAKRRTLFQSLQNDIIDTLLARCQGMFQWTALQIQQIAKCNTPEAVRSRLQTLPENLKTAYDEIYSEIEALEENEKALADRALLWVMSACKPLNTNELLSAIRVELKGGELHFASEIDESVLLSICKNLLVIDSQLQVWRFPHLSVAEYLETKSHFSLQKSHSKMSLVCLAYLSYLGEQSPIGEIKAKFPLAEYSARYWMYHAGPAETEKDVQESILNFFLQQRQAYAVWGELLDPDRLWDEKPRRCDKMATPLYYASSAGLQHTVELLLEKGADVSAQGGEFGNALQAASAQGHREVVQQLLEKGADVSAQGGEFGNALQAASIQGHREVVQLLLEKGADVNAQGGFCGNALQAASVQGYREVVQLLLEKGADVNAQGGHYGSALCAASVQGKEVVQLLLEKGADVNAQCRAYGSALQAASMRGPKEVVQLLLEKGADVNAQGGLFGSALCAASFNGRKEVVQQLLEKGADVNAQGGHFGSALHAASSKGCKEVVQQLLEKGADVNAQGGEFDNALQAASKRGKTTVQT